MFFGKNIIYIVTPIWKKERWYVVLSMIGVLCNIPTRMLNVYTLSNTVNFAIDGQFNKVIKLCCFYFIYMLIVAVIKHIFNSTYKIQKEEMIKKSIKKDLYKKAIQLDISIYDEPSFYDCYDKTFKFIETRTIETFNKLIKLLRSVVSAITYLGVMFVLSPIAVVIIVFFCVTAILFDIKKAVLVKEKNDKEIPIERRINYIDRIIYQQEYSLDIRVEGIKEILFEDYANQFLAKIKLVKKIGRGEAIDSILSDCALLFADSVTWVYYGWQIFTGMIMAGDFVSLSNSTWGLTQQVYNIFNIIPLLYEDSLLVEEVKRFVRYENKIKNDGNRVIEKGIERLNIFNCCFSYDGKSNALSNISICVNKGEKVGIVGHNGAGKSTLIKLILRLYEPQNGKIYINGEEYSKYRIESLRKEISVVFQQCNLYAYSIAENILMRSPRCKNDESVVKKVLDAVGLLNKIERMPDGIHTKVTKEFDNGIKFSGGEIQKIAIARALAKNGSIVVMDEPSSALDPLAEKEIIDLINNLFKDKLVILIAHKLSLVKDMNNIIVMEEGRIVEQGRHQELLDKKGIYAKMWYVQVKGFEEKRGIKYD